jgi:hypothetical protein
MALVFDIIRIFSQKNNNKKFKYINKFSISIFHFSIRYIRLINYLKLFKEFSKIFLIP